MTLNMEIREQKKRQKKKRERDKLHVNYGVISKVLESHKEQKRRLGQQQQNL